MSIATATNSLEATSYSVILGIHWMAITTAGSIACLLVILGCAVTDLATAVSVDAVQRQLYLSTLSSDSCICQRCPATAVSVNAIRL